MEKYTSCGSSLVWSIINNHSLTLWVLEKRKKEEEGKKKHTLLESRNGIVQKDLRNILSYDVQTVRLRPQVVLRNWRKLMKDILHYINLQYM